MLSAILCGSLFQYFVALDGNSFFLSFLVVHRETPGYLWFCPIRCDPAVCGYFVLLLGTCSLHHMPVFVLR